MLNQIQGTGQPIKKILVSFKPAYDYLVNRLANYNGASQLPFEILNLLLSEALNFSEHWIETNFVEYAVNAINEINVPDDYFASDVCRSTSELITQILVEQLPDFGSQRYTGTLTYELISIYNAVITIQAQALDRTIYRI